MVRILHATVTLLVLLAGCAALPGGESRDTHQHTVSITVSNNHDESHVVRVTTIPHTVEGLEVTYENGSTHSFDVSSFDALPRNGLRNATAIDTTDSRELTKEFTVEPAAGVGATFESAPANATVVYFVLRDSDHHPVRSVGVVRCTSDTEATDLEVIIRPDGSVHSAVTCRTEADPVELESQ